MFTGFILAICAGAIWTLGGVANSSCARFKLDLTTYLLLNMNVSMFLAVLFYLDWTRIDRGTFSLALIMIPAGILNTLGALFLQKGLKHGHHGMVFLIAQSALLLPFLCGVVVFGENPSWLRWIGALFILAGMFLCALPKLHFRAVPGMIPDRRWLVFSILAFLFFGAAQSLMSVPSYWNGFVDHAGARTTLMYAGSGVFMLFFAGIRGVGKLSFNRGLLAAAVIISILNVFSMRIIFSALNHLAASGLAATGFPLATGASLIGFTLYSIAVMRERCYPETIGGLMLLLTGGTLIAI